MKKIKTECALSGLIPVIYDALDKLSEELPGIIPGYQETCHKEERDERAND